MPPSPLLQSWKKVWLVASSPRGAYSFERETEAAHVTAKVMPLRSCGGGEGRKRESREGGQPRCKQHNANESLAEAQSCSERVPLTNPPNSPFRP